MSARRLGKVHVSDSIGAVDGSYVFIRSPGPGEEDAYHNRKWPIPALLLLIVADADLMVRFVDCSHPGSHGDKRAFTCADATVLRKLAASSTKRRNATPAQMAKSTTFLRKLDESIDNGELLSVPDDYVLLGDGGFMFHSYLLTSPSVHALNNFKAHLQESHESHNDQQHQVADFMHLAKVISSQRVVVEITFGHLLGAFTVLRERNLAFSRMQDIAVACCILHNLRRSQRLDSPDDHEVSDPSMEFERIGGILDEDALDPFEGHADHVGCGFKAATRSSHEHEARRTVLHRFRAAKRPRQNDDPLPAQRMRFTYC
jgi:hypothetical protein